MQTVNEVPGLCFVFIASKKGHLVVTRLLPGRWKGPCYAGRAECHGPVSGWQGRPPWEEPRCCLRAGQPAGGAADLGLPTHFPSCTHSSSPSLRSGCEEVLEGDRVWEGGGRAGVLPAPLWERKPGFILAGIPGLAEELSHGRGQSGERAGDPELARSEKEGLGVTFYRGAQWVLLLGSSKRDEGRTSMGDKWRGQNTRVPLGLDRRS